MLDIEDVKNDPEYSSAADAAKMIITGHNKKDRVEPETEKFIRSAVAEKIYDISLEDEIGQIRHEADQSNVREITSEWVEEWLRKSDKNEGKDPKTEEIREFITSSLNREEPAYVDRPKDKKRRIPHKSLIISYTSLAAAVVIGAVFLIRSLLPAGDTQKLFNKYYEPFNAVSTVTRGAGIAGTAGISIYNRAVENYRSGDFRAAETGFTEAMLYESTSLPAGFLLGITEIELENPGRAIELLGKVADRQGEYAKEATWYLGLAYIKSGNKEKASECFEILAGSPGFYRDRSENILRRLR